MIFICFILLVGMLLFKPRINEQKNAEENKYSGFDQRPINNNNNSDGDINVIRGHFYNLDILKLLESNLFNENQKLSIIYKAVLFDELNPNIIMAPNLTKGLKW
jgi:hypothetical protein